MKPSIDTEVLSSYSLKEQDNFSYILASTQKIDPFSGVSYLQLRKKQIEVRAEKLIQRFPHSHNQNLLRTINYVFAIFEEIHLLQFRELELLQLIRTIYLFQYSYEFFDSTHGSFVFRFLPTHIFTNGCEKKILSLVVKSKALKKYDCLEDEHVLRIVQNQIPNVRIIPGSSYNLYNQKHSSPLLYFQIEKTSYDSFLTSEIVRLKKNFGPYLPDSIQTRLPYIFCARNEEEIFKNMLTLSKEITTLEDIPQVIISQENSTESGVHFIAIIIRIQKKRQPFFSESVQNMNLPLQYRILREQIVRFFQDNYPIVASVISIRIPITSEILRRNYAIDFYTSRKIVSQFLFNTLGEFRDYNGGMIVKQQELLFALKSHAAHLSSLSTDIIEDFFYSLNPIETQATMSLDELIFLYSCFLQTITCKKNNTPNFFYVTYRNSDHYCTSVSIANNDRNLGPLQFVPEVLHKKMVTYHVYLQDIHLLGYFYRESLTEIRQSLELSIERKYQLISPPAQSRISFSLPILSLDPRLAGDESSIALLQLLFEGLMQYDRNGILAYGLASSTKIDPEYRCYSFTLRETFWSNRSPVTASDFLYTWKKTLHPKFFSPFSHLLYPIKNAKAIKEGKLPIDSLGVIITGSLSFDIHLEYPITQFLHFLTHPIYFPISAATDQSNPNWLFQMGSDYVCNGPFILESRKDNGYYALQKNSLFWNTSVMGNNRMTISYDQPQEAYNAFKKNDIDYYGPLPSSWKNNDDEHHITFPMNSMYCYLYNTQRSYFKNVHLRLAFGHAIDRKKILQSISANTYISLYEEREIIITPPIYNSSLALHYYKLAMHTLELTAKAPLRVVYLDSPTRRHIIQLLCTEWSSLFNIKFQLEPLPWNQLIARMLQGNFDIGGLMWQSSFEELSYMLFSLSEELIPFTNWETEEYRKTLELIKIYGSTEQTLIKKAIGILEKYLPIVPVFSLNYVGYSKLRRQSSLHKHPCNFRYFAN
ncbi:MAG: ABC transporter substrate-binding protein [Chlamydiales bacterium]